MGFTGGIPANRIRWDYTLTLSEPADFGNCYFGIGLNEAMLGRTVRLLSEQEESVVLDAEKEGCLHHAVEPSGAGS